MLSLRLLMCVMGLKNTCSHRVVLNKCYNIFKIVKAVPM